jgi:hypothetical protein
MKRSMEFYRRLIKSGMQKAAPQTNSATKDSTFTTHISQLEPKDTYTATNGCAHYAEKREVGV